MGSSSSLLCVYFLHRIYSNKGSILENSNSLKLSCHLWNEWLNDFEKKKIKNGVPIRRIQSAYGI